MKTSINMAAYDTSVKVLGPGKRFVVWFQGCPFNCSSCINQSFKAFTEATVIEVAELCSIIKKTKGLEGVTITGGEPFAQPKALLELVMGIKGYDLGIQVYTGFLFDELKDSKNSDICKVLENIDVLIDGPFIEREKVEKSCIGSKNQKIHFLSNRYKEEDFSLSNGYEVKIEKDKVEITGFYL